MQLYPYQREGAKWLAGRERGLLADEPGLGKTAQIITACDLVKAKQILIIPPAAVRTVWQREFSTFSMWGHDVTVFDSVEKFESGPRRGVNIINYDLLVRGFEKKSFRFTPAMKKWLDPIWDVTAADEAHGLKERDSLRTRIVLENRGIHGRSDRLWLATGTPMPNHPGELWAILAAMGATDLSYNEFIARYCVMGKHGYSIGQPQGSNPATADELNKLLRTVMKRRLKTLVMPQLPPIRVDDFPIPESKIKIEQFFEDALGDKNGTMSKIREQQEFITEVWQRAIGTGGKMTMFDMIKVLESVGPSVALYRRWLGAVKASAFLPILEDELKTGALKKVVIFAHHKQVIAFLKAKLKPYHPQVLDGSTPAAIRQQAIDNFQNNPAARVFIGQTIAAGTGITLTASHEVVMLEPDWVPANNAQAIMRCHRIGQKNAVRARFVRLADSLDDYISDTLARKTREIVRIVDTP
jgi:SWI/SNF-related matrix-associated actin-dependent regulator 1 of chromatin subfamily A